MTHTSVDENFFLKSVARSMIMQRDLKVGLSLGVLVLGVVGALLFRKEQASDSPRPTLKTARKIDERIAERPRTPYMTGDVEFEPEESTDPDTKAEQAADGRPAHTVPPDWMKDDEDPFQVSRNDKGKFDFRHGVDSDHSSVKPVQPHKSATRDSETAQASLQTHVIQSGDSLSLLAERYLGNQGRFQEIYDANRDVLTDVNRLPLGATIVIPSASKTSQKSQPATTARAAMSQPEKARGTITDITAFEPITPPPTTGAKTEDGQPDSVEEPKTTVTPPTPKTREAKKFVTPSRLPFANHNHSAVSNSSRSKPLDPEGEDFVPTKPIAPSDTAHSATEERHYQVRKGDSLEKIATKIYGNPKRAADIFAANRSLLASPDAVREGQELVLPE